VDYKHFTPSTPYLFTISGIRQPVCLYHGDFCAASGLEVIHPEQQPIMSPAQFGTHCVPIWMAGKNWMTAAMCVNSGMRSSLSDALPRKGIIGSKSCITGA
jgi:hypothetical protein